MKLLRKILQFARRFTEQDELSKVLNGLGLKENLSFLMLAHTKAKLVPTFANYLINHSFMPLSHHPLFLLKSRKTY